MNLFKLFGTYTEGKFLHLDNIWEGYIVVEEADGFFEGIISEKRKEKGYNEPRYIVGYVQQDRLYFR